MAKDDEEMVTALVVAGEYNSKNKWDDEGKRILEGSKKYNPGETVEVTRRELRSFRGVLVENGTPEAKLAVEEVEKSAMAKATPTEEATGEPDETEGAGASRSRRRG